MQHLWLMIFERLKNAGKGHEHDSIKLKKSLKKFQEEGFFLWTQFIKNIQSSLYNVFYCC